MIIGCDASGNVMLLAVGSVMPDAWNGVSVTKYELSKDQENTYNSLPPNGGAVFDGKSFTTLPVVVVVKPDGQGFLQAAKSAMGGILGALALGHYATLLWDAVGTQNWEDVSTLIQAAQTSSVITPQQYAGLKQLAVQYNLPLVLP